MSFVSTRWAAVAALGGSALLAGPGWGAPPDAGDTHTSRTMTRTFTLASQLPVRIDLRYGVLHVEPGEPGRVAAELRIRCRDGSERCSEKLDGIDLEAEPDGRRLDLRVVGLPRFATYGTHVELSVRVPPGGALDIDVGAGEVRVNDVEDDLHVELGAGEIDVRMPEAAVRSVEASAGVGDAHLTHRGGQVTERHHVLGARVDWDGGPGDASVDLQVGAGEVAVRLRD